MHPLHSRSSFSSATAPRPCTTRRVLPSDRATQSATHCKFKKMRPRPATLREEATRIAGARGHRVSWSRCGIAHPARVAARAKVELFFCQIPYKMDECGTFPPSGKWKSELMSESLLNAFSYTVIRRVSTTSAPDCYIAALRVEERLLVDWERDDTGRLSPIVDIFLAYLSFHIRAMAERRAASPHGEKSVHECCLEKCSGFHAFLVQNWGVKGPNYNLREARKLKITRKRKRRGTQLQVSGEFDPDKYLAKYCKDRKITWDPSDNALRKRASQGSYLDLFEEYFGGRPRWRIPTVWGTDGVDDPSTDESVGQGLDKRLHVDWKQNLHPTRRPRLLLVRATADDDSYVGFVCVRDHRAAGAEETSLQLQGVVACPLFAQCLSRRLPESGYAGVGDSLLLQIGEMIPRGLRVVVDPISSNPQWRSRLAAYPFTYSLHGGKLSAERVPPPDESDASPDD